MRIPETGQQMVATVAERWKRQYFQKRWGDEAAKWQDCRGGSEAIYVQLKSLPPTATPADVAAIIGNDGWTGHRCHECSTYEQGVVVELTLGNEAVVLCLACIDRLSAFVAGVREALGAKA